MSIYETYLMIKQAAYERPYTLKEIKKLYGPDLYNKLKNDPVHSWRANTGIELIHDEPSQEEFDRIVNNWRLMTTTDKAKSDEMSRKLFGLTNEEHIKQIEARKFIDEVKKLALKKNLNFFLVTDGASGISNRGNPAVRNAREAQIKWELENGYDPYEDWGQAKDKYSIHGAILGCLGKHAKDFDYNISEKLPNDPWKAIINTKPMSIDKVRQFHKYHNIDVDKAGVPYYFLTRNERTGDKAVWFSDSPTPLPINNKQEISYAKQVGLDKGLVPEQLDFKF